MQNIITLHVNLFQANDKKQEPKGYPKMISETHYFLYLIVLIILDYENKEKNKSIQTKTAHIMPPYEIRWNLL